MGMAAPAVAEPTMLFGGNKAAPAKKKVAKRVVKKVKKVAKKAKKTAEKPSPLSAFFGQSSEKSVKATGRVVPTRAKKAGQKGPAAAQPGTPPGELFRSFFSEENWAYQAVTLLRDL